MKTYIFHGFYETLSRFLLQQTPVLASSPHAERHLRAINPAMNTNRGYLNIDEWLQLIKNDRAWPYRGQNKPSIFHLKRAQTEIRLEKVL